jgi:hypothetical protein
MNRVEVQLISELASIPPCLFSFTPSDGPSAFDWYPIAWPVRGSSNDYISDDYISDDWLCGSFDWYLIACGSSNHLIPSPGRCPIVDRDFDQWRV